MSCNGVPWQFNFEKDQYKGFKYQKLEILWNQQQNSQRNGISRTKRNANNIHIFYRFVHVISDQFHNFPIMETSCWNTLNVPLLKGQNGGREAREVHNMKNWPQGFTAIYRIKDFDYIFEKYPSRRHIGRRDLYNMKQRSQIFPMIFYMRGAGKSQRSAPRIPFWNTASPFNLNFLHILNNIYWKAS